MSDVVLEIDDNVVTFGQQGPPGPQGIQGPPGAPGDNIPAAPLTSGYWALDTTGSSPKWIFLTGDIVAPAFAITSFTGAQTVEVGQPIVNPSFAATYSSLPASVSIANGDAINSPFALTTPFTSVTVAGTWVKTTVNATETWTLTAIGATTKVLTLVFNWWARHFAGVGTAGATGATASGNDAVLVGATGTLAAGVLLSSPVGHTFGPFTPSDEKIYLGPFPHTATPHTFKDENGFGFAVGPGGNGVPLTSSFTNQWGAVISSDLYESTILLSTTFSVSVAT